LHGFTEAPGAREDCRAVAGVGRHLDRHEAVTVAAAASGEVVTRTLMNVTQNVAPVACRERRE
jgi:hypothetical protein